MLLTKMLAAGHVNFEPVFPTGKAPFMAVANRWSQMVRSKRVMRMKSLPALKNTGHISLSPPDIAMPHSQENAKGVHKPLSLHESSRSGRL